MLLGRKIAIDASMALYQFLVAVRSSSNATGGGSGGFGQMMLTNDAGEVTSHIQGMFNRTIKMMTSGIKPVYVFDGKAPEMKGDELAKRSAKRAKAQSDLEIAQSSDNVEDIDKFSKRLVKVTRQHNLDCQDLLKFMGVPFVVALSEAEAQCAELAKKGKVYATATEDMDALTFRTPKLLRKLTFSQGKDKQPIIEIDTEAVLKGLDLTYDQFVDLCILCGCDYCNTIKGIGPKTALKLIRQHKSLEEIIEYLQKNEKKYEIPVGWNKMKIPKIDSNSVKVDDDKDEEEDEIENQLIESLTSEDKVEDCINTTEPENSDLQTTTADIATSDVDVNANDAKDSLAVENTFKEEDGIEYEEVPPLYQQARQLFVNAPVYNADDVELKWTAPDEEGLRTFLVEKMGFNLDRVNSGIKRLQEAQQKKSQQRMDSFFTAVQKPASDSSSGVGAKRKVEDKGSKGKSSGSAVKKPFGKKR